MAGNALIFDFLGNDKTLSKTFDKVGGKADGFGEKMKGLAKTVGAAAIAGAGAAAVGLVKLGSEFDNAYDKIRVGTGATGKVLDSLKQDFKQVVQDVPADFESAGTAIADLNTRLGLTGKPLRERAAQFLELSRITGTDLATNIEAITRVFGDWSIKTGDQSRAMDALFRASQSTGIGVDQLAEKVVQFGAPLRQFGFTFEESIALLGKWEKEGVNAEVVLSGLKQGLGRFSKAGKEPVKALEAIIAKIKGAGSAGEANKLAIEAFGQRAGPDMAAAVREGRLELGDLLNTVKSGKETILAAGKDTQDFGEKLTMLKNKAFVALEPVAMRVFDALGRAMDQIGPVVERLVGLFSSRLGPALAQIGKWVQDKVFPVLKQLGTSLGSALQQVLPGIIGLFKTLAPVLGHVMGFFKQIAPAVGSLAKTIGGFIAALMPTIQKFAGQVVAVLGPALKEIGTMLSTDVIPAIQGFLTAVQPVVKWFLEVLGPAVVGALKGVVEAVKGALNIISGIIKVVTGIITGDWSKAWAGIKQIFSGVWQAIKGIVQVALNGGVLKIFKLGLGLLKGIASRAWTAVKGAFLSALGGLKSMVQGGIRAVVSFFASLPGRALGALRSLGGGLKGLFGRALRAAKDAVVNGANALLSWWRGLPGKVKGVLSGAGSWLYSAGKNIVQGLWNGLKAKIDEVKRWFSNKLQSIRNMFPFSPAKEGPLKTHPMDKAGANIVSMLRQGMAAETPALLAQVREIAGVMSGPTITAGSVSPYTGGMLPMGRGAGEPIVIRLEVGGNPTGLERMFLSWLQGAMRANPGVKLVT